MYAKCGIVHSIIGGRGRERLLAEEQRGPQSKDRCAQEFAASSIVLAAVDNVQHTGNGRERVERRADVEFLSPSVCRCRGEATWKELVLDCDIPVLVDFWAPWCGPCRTIAPLVDELAKLYARRVRCLKRNTDESPNKATEYGIRSISTVLILKRGEKKDAIVGAVSKATLVASVEKYLDR
ncbi:hypothetical protein KP509_13G049600 [Ceratopteris richardii]|uniref:Thioredoxin domain-containing protein n=1 Tax=Ceratopteris richardii TaxID=49495 RepID=A0A8T2TFC0_CERRI|nr:hypothetical protein KP509_13G049600 [Ceratopteris richardii]